MIFFDVQSAKLKRIFTDEKIKYIKVAGVVIFYLITFYLAPFLCHCTVLMKKLFILSVHLGPPGTTRTFWGPMGLMRILGTPMNSWYPSEL